MGENAYGQIQPDWEFRNEGKEIFQKLNSAPFLALGGAQLGDVDYEATLFVDDTNDNDWIGVLFSFQDSSNFYLVMSSKSGSGQGNWQLKRVTSTSGPFKGTIMSNAIRNPGSVPGETEVLWQGSDGWKAQTSVKIRVTHRPKLSLMTVKIWEGATLIAQSGDVIDGGSNSLKGGR